MATNTNRHTVMEDTSGIILDWKARSGSEIYPEEQRFLSDIERFCLQCNEVFTGIVNQPDPFLCSKCNFMNTQEMAEII